MRKLTDNQLQKKYEFIKEYHKKYLEKFNVRLPSLTRAGKYTIEALVLIRLCEGYPNTSPVTKDELTSFVNKYIASTDIQAGRMLGKQSGWYIVTGTRGDADDHKVPRGSYKLISLEKTYPRFMPERRGVTVDEEFWIKLKKEYNNSCACCGSKENEPHRYNPEIKRTKLQKGHKNPNLPLTVDNIIPQCECCNRPDRNNWIYNDEGRVVGIAKSAIIDKCSEEIKKAIYTMLYKHFSGKNPTDI